MFQQHRKRYNEEFKRQAVTQHIDKKETLADSSERLGITPGMLSKWIARYESELNGAGESHLDCEAEILRLQAEMKALKKVVVKALSDKFSVSEITDAITDDPKNFFSANARLDVENEA